MVESEEFLERLNSFPVNMTTKRPLANIRIKSTLVIDDPFEEEQIDFIEPASPEHPKVN